MDHSAHNKIVAFIWSIADDHLRDVYVRGKYRDVILPMIVLRRLDCLLEGSKDAVMEEVAFQKDNGFVEQEPMGLKDASGYVFYNTSPYTLKKLVETTANNRQILEQNFNTYLDGYSPNVQEIINKFDLRRQVKKMASKDVLLEVMQKFNSPYINLTPNELKDPEGRKLPELTNLGMGYVFEELIRKFNEDNNEEAGEHFTPREVIQLMVHLLFDPVKNQLPPKILTYDPACGSGGMLTEAQSYLEDPEGPFKLPHGSIDLYGKEINDETYAICKSDMMIKGNNPENIRVGSTLATNEFADLKFDFMLSNPPYGKSWATDQKYIVEGKEILDSRFEVTLTDYWDEAHEEKATPRSSDGQLLFLMDMVDKIKNLDASPQGSRIASVHNGSSLFTGDAGSGESSIRRYIIENDLLEAIVQLPNNMFYNTGITTYVWLLSNNKAVSRQGKVQLIDGSNLSRKLRKNLGEKNCEFSPEHIQEIYDTYITMPHTAKGDDGISKVFNNEDFGYYKVTVDRPKRLSAQFSQEAIDSLRYVPAIREPMQWLYETLGEEVYSTAKNKGIKANKALIEKHLDDEELDLNAKNKKNLLNVKVWQAQKDFLDVAQGLMATLGVEESNDFNVFKAEVETELKRLKKDQDISLSSGSKTQLYNAITWADERAAKVIKKQHKLNTETLQEWCDGWECNPDDYQQTFSDYGYWLDEVATSAESKYAAIFYEYEHDSDLRDTENVPLTKDIVTYFNSEVRSHVDDAWINEDQTKIGYEVSFNKYFYQHMPLRKLEDVTADIMKLEAETDGLLKQLVSFGEAK
jgi:type I restriction enzyme M protein